MILNHFIIKELIPPEIWKAEGEQSIIHFDEKILISLEQVREFFDKPVTVNNWHVGGQFKYRGFRPEFTKVGAVHSMHREGKAFDFDVKGMTAEEVRQEIIKNRESFPYITRMEKDVNWVHIDCKETGLKDIYLFKG